MMIGPGFPSVIFNVDTEDWRAIELPSDDVTLEFAKAVQMENTFLVTGGLG